MKKRKKSARERRCQDDVAAHAEDLTRVGDDGVPADGGTWSLEDDDATIGSIGDGVPGDERLGASHRDTVRPGAHGRLE